MTRPLAAPSAVNVPTYRYWGATKPPKSYARTKVVASVTAPGTSVAAAPDASSAAGATSATIRLYGPIDSWGGFWGVSAEDVTLAVDSLPDTITDLQLRVNSPGGECWEALTILNMLRAHRATTTAVVDGVAASAASFLVAGCDETVMSPGTQMMIHDASTFAYGNPADIRAALAFLESLSNSMAELYVEKAGGTVAAWRALMDPDTWYTATEATAAGLADRVAVVPDNSMTTTAADDPVVVTPDDDGYDVEAVFDLSIYAHAGRSHAPAPPAATAAATDPRPRPRTGTTTTERGSIVALSDEGTTALGQKLGLAEDADEATILAAVDEALAERADDAPAVTPAAATALPDGMVVVEADVLAQLREGAAAGVAANTARLAQDRDTAIASACAAGKITAARREHWTKAWDADPEGARASLAALEPGLVPVEARGYDDGSEAAGPVSLADIEATDVMKNWKVS